MKQMRLSDNLYDYLTEHGKKGETYCEIVERLIGMAQNDQPSQSPNEIVERVEKEVKKKGKNKITVKPPWGPAEIGFQEKRRREYIMAGFKSHSKDEIRVAIAKGMPVWALDTGADGDDDHLIGSSYNEVVQDILFYHELDNFPDHWTLTKVDWDI